MDNLRKTIIENVYLQWDEFAKTKQVNKLIDLYDNEATLESPLVPIILKQKSGILNGRDEIRHFLEEGTRRRPNELVRWYRKSEYFTNGDTLLWEYPRQTLDGQQVDILELMEINNEGKILHHRIYWGWFGTQMLLNNQNNIK